MSANGHTRQILGIWFLVSLLVAGLVPLAAAGAGSDFEILPYVQNVAKTSATIFWKPAGDVAGRVEYGLTTSYGTLAEGHIEYSAKDGKTQSNQENIVSAQLVDLQPDTVYRYRVRLSSSVSGDREFRTASPNDQTPFTFLVYGDSRSDPQVHARIASAAGALCQPAFVLATGDAVASGSVRQSDWLEQFFEPADSLLRKSWFVVTRGNHDEKSRLLSLHFEAPGGGPVRDYYSFDWGPVHVTTINTNKDFQPGSEQYQFLEQDLAHSSRPFKVFFGHHPVYSSGLHGSTKKMQTYLQPLFEKNGVQVVFAGHDHDYERTIVNGITYIVSGGGGAPLHGQNDSRRNPEGSVFIKKHNFVQVDFAPDTLTLTAWALDGDGVAAIVDEAVVTKRRK